MNGASLHQPEPEQPRESGPDAMWWISWYSDTAMSAFELHSPWWVSGCDAYGNETVVAAVVAPTENAAKEKILRAYDEGPERPEHIGAMRWRIVERLSDGQSPFSDRFPQATWMRWDPPITCRCGVCTRPWT